MKRQVDRKTKFYALAYWKYRSGKLAEVITQDAVTPYSFQKHIIEMAGGSFDDFEFVFFVSEKIRDYFIELLDIPDPVRTGYGENKKGDLNDGN